MFKRIALNIARDSLSKQICRSSSASYCYVLNGLMNSNNLINSNNNVLTKTNNSNLYVSQRFISKKAKKKKEQDDCASSDEESDDEELGKEEEEAAGGKVISISTPGLRLDQIVKAGSGLSRNKVDKLFFSSRLRVNGVRALKKHTDLRIDDEIDIYPSSTEDEGGKIVKIIRIKILDYKVLPSTLVQVKLMRDKNLAIEREENEF